MFGIIIAETCTCEPFSTKNKTKQKQKQKHMQQCWSINAPCTHGDAISAIERVNETRTQKEHKKQQIELMP